MSLAEIIVYTWVILTLLELIRRLYNGANLKALATNAFEEIVPIHWLLKASVGLFYFILVASLILFIRGGWVNYLYYKKSSSFDWSHSMWAVFPLISGFAIYKIINLLKDWLDISTNKKSTTDVSIESISEGISDDEILELGLEKFPNRISKAGYKTIWIRIILFVLFSTAAGTLGYAFFEPNSKFGHTITGCISGLQTFYKYISPSTFGLPVGFDFILPYGCFVMLILFTITNRDYLYLDFTKTWLLFGLLAFGIGFSITSTQTAENSVIFAILIIIPLILCIRILLDLSLLKNYKKRYSILDTIADDLQSIFHNNLKTLSSLKLYYPKIDQEELDARLDQGATNVGSESFLSPPKFGRYLKNAVVKWRHCSAVILRSMTVDRSVDLMNGRGTSASLREPKVPAWDEEMFPLNVPDGYVTWNDYLLLGDEWNVVRTCGGCGGKGQVNCNNCGATGKINCSYCFGAGEKNCASCYGRGYTERTETYYSNGQNQTRQIRTNCSCGNGKIRCTSCSGGKVTCTGCGGKKLVTCGSCSGCGRIMYDQQLTTYWKEETVTSAFPKMNIYEIAEGASEFDFVTTTFVENRTEILREQRTQLSKEDLSEDLLSNLEQSRSRWSTWEPLMKEFQGGTTYRANISLSGFSLIKASFGKILPREGWFFGNRPQFYFPRLPIGWATVGSVVILPLLIIILFATIISSFSYLWDRCYLIISNIY